MEALTTKALALVTVAAAVVNVGLAFAIAWAARTTARATSRYARIAALHQFSTSIPASAGANPNTPAEAHQMILEILWEEFPEDAQRLKKFMPLEVKRGRADS